MDGDLRQRPRRLPRAYAPGETWGYSATIPADLAAPAPAAAQARARIDQPQQAPKEARPAKQDEAQPADNAPPKQKMPAWKKALYWLIGLAILAALIVVGVLYWLHARQFETTDDAFIDGHMSQVSSQVAARVTRLAVGDNDLVQRGQLLVELDGRDFEVKLAQARAQRAQAAAQVDQARAQLLLQQASLDQAEANVRVAEADLWQQQTDLARYRAIDPKAITRQQLDTANAGTRSAAARLDAQKQAVQGARAQIEAQKASIQASEANLAAADVGVENAVLQLSYTKVVAPDDGRVTKRTVEVGNWANLGQSLLAVVPDRVWVTANFKETQLADMKAKQPVRVQVDACPGQVFDAHVDSFQSGTGAVFSSLPAENATGNYVKVVQRVPVRIVFDQVPNNCRLSPGMSVSPRVTVR